MFQTFQTFPWQDWEVSLSKFVTEKLRNSDKLFVSFNFQLRCGRSLRTEELGKIHAFYSSNLIPNLVTQKFFVIFYSFRTSSFVRENVRGFPNSLQKVWEGFEEKFDREQIVLWNYLFRVLKFQFVAQRKFQTSPKFGCWKSSQVSVAESSKKFAELFIFHFVTEKLDIE